MGQGRALACGQAGAVVGGGWRWAKQELAPGGGGLMGAGRIAEVGAGAWGWLLYRASGKTRRWQWLAWAGR
jgi:hypothetical protein